MPWGMVTNHNISTASFHPCWQLNGWTATTAHVINAYETGDGYEDIVSKVMTYLFAG